MQPPTGLPLEAGPKAPLAERLERGEVIYHATCPFALPEGDDRRFLLEQRLSSAGHKNISYDPIHQKTTGYQRQGKARADRLHHLLADFASTATRWLAETLPRYAEAWQLDRVSYRPEEEATRRLRQTARNDLLHVDAFPSRPTNGHRILRLFVNINPSEPRVWMTAESFAQLLPRFAHKVGLPVMDRDSWPHWFRRGVFRLFHPGRRPRSPYDEFMIRFHNYLKADDEYQERCFKRYWSFPPNSSWMVMTDTATHAVLRGRFALEHSYFVSPVSLALPAESPPALLARMCGFDVLTKAA